MEILYRDRLARSSRLITGHLPQQGQISHGQVILQIAVTGATAARFGLRPGSRLGFPPDVTLEVTGIVTPADPGSAFWGVDSVAAAPVLNVSPSPARADVLGRRLLHRPGRGPAAAGRRADRADAGLVGRSAVHGAPDGRPGPRADRPG